MLELGRLQCFKRQWFWAIVPVDTVESGRSVSYQCLINFSLVSRINKRKKSQAALSSRTLGCDSCDLHQMVGCLSEFPTPLPKTHVSAICKLWVSVILLQSPLDQNFLKLETLTWSQQTYLSNNPFFAVPRNLA